MAAGAASLATVESAESRAAQRSPEEALLARRSSSAGGVFGRGARRLERSDKMLSCCVREKN